VEGGGLKKSIVTLLTDLDAYMQVSSSIQGNLFPCETPHSNFFPYTIQKHISTSEFSLHLLFPFR